MNMFGAIFRGIGKLFEWSFVPLQFIGNYFNLLIIIALIGFLGWWLLQLKKFGKADKTLAQKENREIE